VESDRRHPVGGIVARAAPVVVGGVALAAAFPGTDAHALAWVALVPLFLLAQREAPRAAFGWGWLGGTVFFLVLLRWLDHTFRLYSAIPWPLTWLPILALAAYCGLYFGLVSGGVAWLGGRIGRRVALASAPALWVAGEWVRGWLMGGFPWGLAGYSQHSALPVIQIAEVGGVYAVSFLVVAVNAAIAGVIAHGWRRAMPGALAAAGLLASALAFGWTRLADADPDRTVSVALVQPSIEQAVKWNPAHQAPTLSIELELTRRAAAARPGLNVWPETATPTALRRDPVLQQALRDLSATAGAPIVVGSIDVSDSPPDRYYNTAFLLSERGIVGRYDKIQLVPFGEFVPLWGVIGFVRGWAEFIADLEPGSAPVVFPGPPAPFGVVICYEGIFPALVREFVRGGARLMVNMTNDAWFGQTSGPLQHLAMYPLRAVEHRVSVVRAANTGVSAFISPTGRIADRAELYERRVLRGAVALRAGDTLYTRFGDWLAWVCVTTVFALCARALLGRRRAQ
jgi:apolipoprotein N-acyltransferase